MYTIQKACKFFTLVVPGHSSPALVEVDMSFLVFEEQVVEFCVIA
jgi:hypothetical protein